ncbi:E3 ubiquitin-protein ligase RNF34-like isoform X3 [Poecilia latipinna]|uniref:E3 ubiquitin-protein ligase RNF34-like isoform X3 n=1 Tax=Poecilia formosa TaxID=48698 RepID=UPI000443BA69|nr:PREDICTED: E3 ubiquitin-protein ligase RNF34-like isoform X3 [Poecilia formosa]XP_014897869.1 PREDICTED: E3 ubiquitin-protein ligase RNF34-like isoform X3 [Poecilia latipinna]
MRRLCVNDFLAGASSVWASCCGLLNEVMGTGAVRGQQPGFGAGAGPFRFAPSAGYSTHPPNSSGNPGLVCRACGQAFSVFRIKYTCCDCKKSFCSLCTEVLESLRICATCHLLKATAFHRPRLMRLPVRDLRQYLLLRSISTDTCREKEDLVDLVLCHRAFEVEDEEEEDEDEEEDDDDDDDDDEEVEDPNTASLLSHIHRTLTDSIAPPASELSAATLEESLSRSESPETNQTSPQTRHGAGASVSDISSVRDIKGLSVRQLKEILARNFVNYSGCCEKWELVERVNRLYREKEKNTNTYGEKCPLTLQDDNLCRICMDAVIDCVLLECGHLVTCTDCGKRMNQCPICRQYVVRAVHVFKC